MARAGGLRHAGLLAGLLLAGLLLAGLPVLAQTSRVATSRVATSGAATPRVATPGVATPGVSPAAHELWLAQPGQLIRLQRDGARQVQPLPASLQTPLGSTWKLFVYLYLTGREQRPPDYACQGQHAEEVFCCSPGQTVNAERALVQSCGLYFDPQRLAITAADWRRFWLQQSGAPRWLLDINALQPGRTVPVHELLAGLQAAPPAAARQAQAALLGLTLDGRAAGTVRHFGSGVRLKSWTWDRPDLAREKMGGGAGWLADGQVVWLAGRGASSQVLQQWARPLAPVLQRTAQPLFAQPCVEVRLFERYPIAAVRQRDGRLAGPGPLQGDYDVEFRRGTRQRLQALGDVTLRQQDGQWQLQLRLDVNEYVARVVEREAAPEPEQAARALAVAARTYLLQNARHVGGCWQIADSSARQRVLPRPAGAAARQLALWTDGLIVQGQTVQYHRDQHGPGQLGWQQAVALAHDGLSWVDILARYFPAGRLASLHAPDSSQCRSLPHAEQWLRAQLPHWRRQLQHEAGFEMPGPAQVCQQLGARPQVDIARRRLFVRGDLGLDGRLSLAHEWLHLAFAWHARGRDEVFIETMARQLLGAPQE